MNLNQCPKVFEGFKCDFPENTIQKIKNGFKKLGLNLIYTENVVSHDNISLYSGYLIVDEIGFSCNGKGTSSLLSKASAYAEMAERFSSGFFFFNIPLPKASGKYRKMLADITDKRFLKGYEKDKKYLIDLHTLSSLYFRETISSNRYKVIRNSGLLDAVVDAYSFVDKKWRKIPIKLIEALSVSNGLAAGNSFEEAFTQGSCEIFERYSATEIMNNLIICPTIKNESIENEKLKDFIEMFNSMNIEIILKDFSMGNKVPVVGAIFINHNIEYDKNLLKRDKYYKRIECGSHIDLEEAILRCFIEYIQGIKDEKELMYMREYDLIYDCWTKKIGKPYIKDKEKFRYFVRRKYDYSGNFHFLEKGKTISFDKLISIKNNDALDDCKKIISICKENDWDLQIVNCTNKVLNFPTLRVIIPPISIDFDPFIRKISEIKDFEKKINFFYGIKDFYHYVKQDKWITDKKEIRKLIKNLEEFLSKEPYSYKISITRENHFNQWINLYHLLGFLNLSIERYEESLRYFDALIELSKLNRNIITFSDFLKISYNTDFYKDYKDLIKYFLEKDKSINFSFTENPFNPQHSGSEIENYYTISITKIITEFF